MNTQVYRVPNGNIFMIPNGYDPGVYLMINNNNKEGIPEALPLMGIEISEDGIVNIVDLPTPPDGPVELDQMDDAFPIWLKRLPKQVFINALRYFVEMWKELDAKEICEKWNRQFPKSPKLCIRSTKRRGLTRIYAATGERLLHF